MKYQLNNFKIDFSSQESKLSPTNDERNVSGMEVDCSATGYNNLNPQAQIFEDSTNPNRKNYIERRGTIQDIQKDFIGLEKFHGRHDEDLKFAIEHSKEVCDMYDVSERTKRKSISIMLTDNARNFYRTHVLKSDDYETVVCKLKNEYNTAEKCN